MIKLFGLRITPFFLLIIALQSLALLVATYIGLLMYQNTSSTLASTEITQQSYHLGILLIITISTLAPAFVYQTKVINYLKKTLHEKSFVFFVAVITMFVITLSQGTNLNVRTLFVAALISACVGLVVGQFNLLSKYWRFLVRSGMN